MSAQSAVDGAAELENPLAVETLTMKVVNETTGGLFIDFDFRNGASGCGQIYPGGDPIEKTDVQSVRISVFENIEYEDVPEEAVVTVLSRID